MCVFVSVICRKYFDIIVLEYFDWNFIARSTLDVVALVVVAVGTSMGHMDGMATYRKK